MTTCEFCQSTCSLRKKNWFKEKKNWFVKDLENVSAILLPTPALLCEHIYNIYIYPDLLLDLFICALFRDRLVLKRLLNNT